MGRVFIGYNNIVGVGIALKKGFQKNQRRSEFFSLEKNLHAFDYLGDEQFIHLKISRKRFWGYIDFIKLIIRQILFYKYFIIIQASETLMPDFRDIKILRFFRKKTLIIYAGCDVRMPETVEMLKWNSCSGCNTGYKKMVGCEVISKKRKLRIIEKTFNYIASPLECSGYIHRQYNSIWFPIDLDYYKVNHRIQREDASIRILHAPSNSHIKGTRYINDVMKAITEKYQNVEYILVQNKSKQEVLEIIQSVDLVIDQMLVGFYGMFAIESMALGKPVVTYFRPDLWEQVQDFCPVYNANPDTLYHVLEDILADKKSLEVKGKLCRKYVEDYHDCNVVANEIIRIMKIS